MGLEVYLDPCTVNSRKVLAGLDLLGTQYHLNYIDYFAGQQKSPYYIKEINPCATVPCAKDGPLTITESNAILIYIAECDGGNPAYPHDLKKRTSVNRWLLWEASVWFASNYKYLVEFVVKPLLGQEPDQRAIEEEAPNWHRLATILNDQLTMTEWIAGDELTIADIAIASPMHLHGASRLPLDQYPQLKKWMTERIEVLPCWQKTQAAVEKALLPNKAAANGTINGHTVRSMLNYSKNLNPKLTELYFYDSEKAAGIHEPGDDPREVTIHDGWDRNRSNPFSVDKEGFSLHDFRTGFEKWEEEETVKAEFYPEVVDFLKKQLNAKRVLVFDHTIRTKANEAKKLTQETNTSQRAPVMLVHCDYTAESGPLRVRQLLGEEAEDLLSRRVAFINVWKPIRNVVEERPLAMCDVTTSPSKDFFKLYINYRERTGENYVLSYSPNHHWWYLPKISPAHAILLKTFDSENDGRARFVGHSAFLDPTTRADAPVRESIEIRTIVFF